MGPCHAPDYVDVFMGELDNKLVQNSPIQLLENDSEDESCWSRFRDDGFTVIPNEEDVHEFEKHLQGLCPWKISWTINKGKEQEYLDVRAT